MSLCMKDRFSLEYVLAGPALTFLCGIGNKLVPRMLLTVDKQIAPTL